MKRSVSDSFAILLWLFALPGLSAVKIAGVEFVPKDLVFAVAEAKSRAIAEGSLPNDCKWSFMTETRIGRREEAQGCIRFYYRTTVTLTELCAAKETVRKFAERITALESRCPDSGGRVTTPPVDARAVSSGVTVDGKSQEIVLQPDGTRVILSYDAAGVTATAVFPDGTVDVLKLP